MEPHEIEERFRVLVEAEKGLSRNLSASGVRDELCADLAKQVALVKTTLENHLKDEALAELAGSCPDFPGRDTKTQRTVEEAALFDWIAEKAECALRSSEGDSNAES